MDTLSSTHVRAGAAGASPSRLLRTAPGIAAAAALFLFTMAAQPLAQRAPTPKVGVCHLDDGGVFRLLSISVNAASAHMAHGDGLPGGLVPGGDGFTFDQQCGTEAPPPPPTVVRVFVSSTSYTGAIGGLSGADASCQQLATDAGLGGSWKAFLSDSTVNAYDRFTHPIASAGYRLVDGTTVVALGESAFFSTTHLAGIGKDESGNDVANSEVWTGSYGSGVGTGGHCDDWTSADPGPPYGTQGLTSRTDGGWAWAYLNFCDRQARLYCVEQ